MKNPANFAKHQSNPKVAPVIAKMMGKFGGSKWENSVWLLTSETNLNENFPDWTTVFMLLSLNWKSSEHNFCCVPFWHNDDLLVSLYLNSFLWFKNPFWFVLLFIFSFCACNDQFICEIQRQLTLFGVKLRTNGAALRMSLCCSTFLYIL